MTFEVHLAKYKFARTDGPGGERDGRSVFGQASPTSSTKSTGIGSSSNSTSVGCGAAKTISACKTIQRQLDYPKEMTYFLLSAIVLFTLINWTRKGATFFRRRSRRHVTAPDIEGSAHQKGSASWRRLPSAVASCFRVLAFRLPLPLGFGNELLGSEFFIIAAYMIAVWTWTLINTDGLRLDEYYLRSGVMAVAQIPFIIGLAGKNNVISYLTGVSHEKLNILHRASARTCLILLWIHFFGNYLPGLSPKHDFTHGWVVSGAVGLAGLTLGAVLSLQPVRRRAFEFFLVAHILLILIFLIGAWYHLLHFRTPTARWMDYYMWPGFILWGLDRLARVGRIFWNTSIWRRDAKEYSQATVEMLSGDTLRMILKRRASWTAGQHAYVVLPSVSALPTEAHPFTIASVPSSLDGSVDPVEKDVVFIIRARTGFTSQMLDVAKRGTFSVPAYMDGPYGLPPDLTPFSTVVLVAGGSGVSYTLSMLLNLVSLANKKESDVRRIVFIWIIRQREHINWIAKSLNSAMESAPSSLSIITHIHATNMESETSGDLSTLTEHSTPGTSLNEKRIMSRQSLGAPSTYLKVLGGRPNIRKIIKDEIDTAIGPMSVDVCGPSSLTSTVRKTLRFDSAGGLAVLNGRALVTLHVEKFGM